MVGSFIYSFFRIVWRVGSIFLALLALIIASAVVIAAVEGMPMGQALYFAFITGLTVGYGDIVPTTAVGRIISVFQAFVGILFTGLVVAVAVQAVREAWDKAEQVD
ncbi:MAG: two pore domain potassium channel family protein [Deltaproteobacteria bacterium]|nr:two pore domain potassium channel family protein [Deltaproteobacteria bacterium]